MEKDKIRRWILTFECSGVRREVNVYAAEGDDLIGEKEIAGNMLQIVEKTKEPWICVGVKPAGGDSDADS